MAGSVAVIIARDRETVNRIFVRVYRHYSFFHSCCISTMVSGLKGNAIKLGVRGFVRICIETCARGYFGASPETVFCSVPIHSPQIQYEPSFLFFSIIFPTLN